MAPTTNDEQRVMPLEDRLRATAAVQRLDIAEMHEKVSGILAFP